MQGELAMARGLHARRLGGIGQPDLWLDEPAAQTLDGWDRQSIEVRTCSWLQGSMALDPCEGHEHSPMCLVVGQWPLLEEDEEVPDDFAPYELRWVGWHRPCDNGGVTRSVGKTPNRYIAQADLRKPQELIDIIGRSGNDVSSCEDTDSSV